MGSLLTYYRKAFKAFKGGLLSSQIVFLSTAVFNGLISFSVSEANKLALALHLKLPYSKR